MKNLLAFLLLFSSFSYAQYSVNGTMTPALESDWVILYKIEGARQVFVQNTKIKTDSVTVNGKKRAIGSFNFTLPANAKVGSYRATYRLKEAGFVDFFFNKENIHFAFNSDYPDQSVVFSESNENILYQQYLEDISIKQQKLDSIQIAVLRNANLELTQKYTKSLMDLNTLQKQYLAASKDFYIHPFIKATIKNNPPEMYTSAEKYMSNITDTFFDTMDFSDPTLLNSSFLVDRITDFVFYINYSDDFATQQNLHIKSIDTVISNITNIPFKKDALEYLITQFAASNNLEIFDYLFNKYYNKLPESLQNHAFKEEKMAAFAAEVGRIAPNFTWRENKKNFSLAELEEADTYILIFWSTSCSHCLKEIPEVYQFLQENKKVKVIAFSMEKDDFGWKNMKTTLPNWHHVLGLNKWENKTARTYNINATPSYFVLDKNKKIIAKPEELIDLKEFIEKL
ncbi:hypothetical protein BTO04_10710 [Polaribacter sp. SA4-10]|uniref:TlpA family protein disulfide reductase n=1 Tax=Polaribacter sp. SA4-10 TaxID=754397 RepID=UPI000B3CE5A7|nr:TlpA disulfide reductase family protein [Polaribacter sp. SA4-10]ARV07128.1 hypothetical protein BTO04_10710 [Polaribacter sp. SA4-10]